MDRIGRIGMAGLAAACLVGLLAGIAAGAPAFTGPPTATRVADGVRIDFSVPEPTDVTVVVLDAKGNVLARLSDQPFGDEAGRFYAPHAIASDSRGDIYVAEVSYADFGRLMDPPRELRSLQKLTHKG